MIRRFEYDMIWKQCSGNKTSTCVSTADNIIFSYLCFWNTHTSNANGNIQQQQKKKNWMNGCACNYLYFKTIAGSLRKKNDYFLINSSEINFVLRCLLDLQHERELNHGIICDVSSVVLTDRKYGEYNMGLMWFSKDKIAAEIYSLGFFCFFFQVVIVL